MIDFFNRNSSRKKTAKSAIARGDAARDKLNWHAAVKAYKEALDQKSDLPEVWVQYAHALKEAGKVDEAIEAYQQALVERPEDAETYVHLAHALKRQNRRTEAIEAFAAAVALNPSDKEAANELHDLKNVPPALPSQESESFLSAQRSQTANEDVSAAVVLQDALQTPYAELLSENDALKAQLREHQAELERSRAMAVRLAALQTLYDDLLAENDALNVKLTEQQEQQSAIEDNQKAVSEERDQANVDIGALKELVARHEVNHEKLEASLAETATDRDAAQKEVDALKKQAEDNTLRVNLAQEEFLRSEGQIELIKDLILRESGL